MEDPGTASGRDPEPPPDAPGHDPDPQPGGPAGDEAFKEDPASQPDELPEDGQAQNPSGSQGSTT